MQRYLRHKSIQSVQEIWTFLCTKFAKINSNEKYFSIASRLAAATVFILLNTLSVVTFNLINIASLASQAGATTDAFENNHATLILIAGLTLSLTALIFSYLLIVAKESNDLALKVCKNKLKQKRSQLYSFLEASPAGVFILDNSGMFHYINSKMQKICGASHSTFTEKAWFKSIHSEDKEHIVQAWKESISNRTAFEHEFRILDNENKVTWARVKILSLLNERQSIGSIGVVEDISEIKALNDAMLKFAEMPKKKVTSRKQKEVELQKALEIQASQANSTNLKFITTKLHTIRTNLTSFIGFMGMFEKIEKSSAEYDHTLDILRSAAKSALSDCEEILCNATSTEKTSEINISPTVEIGSLGGKENEDQPHVLLVEDDTVSQKLFIRNLQKLGIIPTVVSDGKVAVSIAMKGKFDFILMDLDLPGLSAFEATKMLRSKGCKTPIIALSADGHNDYKANMGKNGWQDFLAKPCLHKDLIQIVERYGRNRSSL